MKKLNSREGDPEEGQGGAWGVYSQNKEKRESYHVACNKEGVLTVRPERQRERRPRLAGPC